ncbi:F-box/LRR-repeat protein At4g14103-like [Vicia villosa]|uniref:F-box/LRR-repeat protein At4g14103-like n=1 Tax=Vicia villosa TaxID=3911 RepID=UPI00273BE2DD|nr:F-box/LRR-repeat protein At4g14103-like [Vicia villosa]
MADILSTFPDEVLCHILSFLRTKHAVATSVLSKRWNHLWHSVPVLDFTNTILTNQNANFRFNDFVYSVLLSRISALPIKAFKISLTYDYIEDVNLRIPNFSMWINFLLQGGVQHLDLFLGLPGVRSLPYTLLTCKTLVSLNLLFFSINVTPPSIQLPSLKTLYLRYTFFPRGQDFMLLLAGCPILEDLLVSKLWWFPYKDSLTTNRWKNFTLTNLTQATIDSTYFHFPLEPLLNVHSLSISMAKMDSYNHVLPTFHNLTSLDLNSFNYRWHFLIQLLKHSPNLQTLKLNEAGTDEESWTRKDDKENWVDPDFVPQCLSLHLKTCHLLSFLGLQGEFLLAKYILKNSTVLQTMKIWNGGQPEIERLLQSCPRASSMCKLTVYHVSYDDGASELNLPLDTSGSCGGGGND